MPPETAHPIEKGNVYNDVKSDYVHYVRIDDFYVDESGETQIRVSQYTGLPISAHNSAGHLSGVSGKRTLALNDIRDRILKSELLFECKD